MQRGECNIVLMCHFDPLYSWKLELILGDSNVPSKYLKQVFIKNEISLFLAAQLSFLK